ncbi:Na+/H+ antiporter NhaC family protein [Sinanaerobacter chloroacetimidivorans]|uniref:Sodium:proton antiporter n=1 Tax=Sinanaerobacter chloroacetimidivorans TaxID=2818044 RepID=A0A8J8B241_9FIRM|nr:Na+/H+ antiporter NhaC family protein [Sinanaerobacter chloroacetimidivorans]MBR0598899.1 sodium:proton antiporter [Sinanaerobacter chloroacetimidivorans]
MEATVNYGLITLLPPIIVIAFALITRKTFEALIIGAVAGYIIAYGTGFFGPFLDALQGVVADDIWMFITLGLFGSFVALLKKSNGTYGFANLVQKFSNTRKKSLVISWILGILIFMDDYLNILTISSSMRDLCDRQKTPREMLAYVIDSTGAPVCVLIPISTWAIFYGGVIGEQAGMDAYGSGMDIYIQSIPFLFYGWVAIIVVPLVILGVIPLMFGMKKAYHRVDTTGRVYSEASDRYNKVAASPAAEEASGKANIWNFILPLVVIVAVTIYTGDMLIGLIAAIVLALILYLPAKVMTFTEFSEELAAGFASMIPMLFILAGAFVIKASMDEIGLPQYVINGVLPYMNAQLFPAITLIVVACLSFVTGSNWGIPALTVPILIPLALAGGANPILVFAAIVSGGTFGSHACFYSDATVLTSQSCGIENLEHAFTQIPYALISAALSLILFVVFGYVI